MVGRDIKALVERQRRRQRTRPQPAVQPLPQKRVVRRRGEILGFAGLVGAGRSEMAKAMVGLDPRGGGQIAIGGEPVPIRHARDAKAQGIYLVPEDRRAEGLIVRMSVRENVTLPSLDRFTAFRLISRARERKAADEQIASLGIKTPDRGARHESERRKPAESGAGQVVVDVPEGDDPRRADPRRGRGRQS
jgi:ribose transport system ATP-binding protein